MTVRYDAIVCAWLLLCLVLGGGGTSNPVAELVLECVAAPLALLAIWFAGTPAMPRPTPRVVMAMAVLALLIPVAQLIPLPPSMWHALPGRQSEIDALALIGQAQHWMPWTLTPARTFASLLAIIVEVGLFVAASRLDLSKRMSLCAVIVAVGIMTTLLGSLQLSRAGGYDWSLYTSSHAGWVLGFHGNRNAATDTLQIAILAVAALLGAAAARKKASNAQITLAVLLILALAISTVLTGSRTGILLLPLTYLFVALLVWPLFSRTRPLISWGILLAIPIVCAALALTGPVHNALARFAADGDHRWDIWHDTLRATGSVWPAGSGIGSFQVVYDAAQSIERMQALRDLRAHNDWLEWVLEAGVPGLVVLVAIGGILLVRNLQALRLALRHRADPCFRSQVLFATGTMLHLGLHAIFDYPMRSMALTALIAVAAAMLMPPAKGATVPE